MLKTESTELIDWIESAIDYSNIKSNSLRISNFLPKFDHYIGITWKVGVIKDFPFEQLVSNPVTVEEINNNAKIWRSFPQIYGYSENGFKEIDTKELFKMFNIPYHEYKNDNKLPWNSRAIRILERKIIENLSTLLNEISDKNDLLLYWEDYYRYGIEDKLFKITIDEFLTELQETGFDSSLYLFPENKDWCLVNLEDLGFNIFAFNDNVKNKMKFLSEIENFKLTYESELY